MERQPQLIELTPELARQLRGLVHPYMELEKKGYIMGQLSEEALDKKRRCENCNQTLSAKALKILNAQSVGTVPAGAIDDESSKKQDDKDDVRRRELWAHSISRSSTKTTWETSQWRDRKGAGPGHKAAEPKNHCSFHTGRVGRNKQWTCCGGHPMSKPCHEEQNHVQVACSKGDLEKNWRFENTPSRRIGGTAPLVAVVVDCEMGTAQSNESELIRISMIDYFTGTTLVDQLVWPDVQMAHFNTRFSGVTRQAMNQARRDRTCLWGRHGARMAIWEHVGPETVVIGHSLNSDLTSLRWIHHCVVDTLMIEEPYARKERERLVKLAEAHATAVLAAQEKKQPEPPKPPKPEPQHPGCSLKVLTKAYLQRDIQLRGRGHDSLEDATATRDLLHFHVVNRLPKPKPAAVGSPLW